MPAVIARWDSYAAAGAVRWESNVINVAHKLADFTLHEPCMLTRELLVLDQGYRDLGLAAQDAEPLFDSTAVDQRGTGSLSLAVDRRGFALKSLFLNRWIDYLAAMKDTTLVNHPPEVSLLRRTIGRWWRPSISR